MQDQFGFTLHHLVTEKKTNDQVTVSIGQGAKQRFPQVSQVSYDRGFWSKENLEALEGFLDRAILPKKGKWAEQDRQRERHPEFVRAKRKHSAVESDINALEQHGLDRCPDTGIDGFRRYTQWISCCSAAAIERNPGSVEILRDRSERMQPTK